jgi:hypothetical protein
MNQNIDFNCKICNAKTKQIFNKTILNKYSIDYFQCSNCNFIQTEEPYWLEEVYKEPINTSDTGLIARNVYLSRFSSMLIYFYFNKNSKFLDYAGGYGIFTRLMRDVGFDFFWQDPFTINLFAKGFEWNKDDKIELLTTFECFEHLNDPIKEIEEMLKISSNILFSTELNDNKDLENWWYLGTQHGQHIALYSKKSLEYIAEKYDLYLYTNNSTIHLLTKQKKFLSVKFIQILLKLNFDIFIKKVLKSKTSIDSNFVKEQDSK